MNTEQNLGGATTADVSMILKELADTLSPSYSCLWHEKERRLEVALPLPQDSAPQRSIFVSAAIAANWEESGLVVLSFLCPILSEIPEEKMFSVIRLASWLNELSAIPGWVVRETQGNVNFEYLWLGQPDMVDPTAIDVLLQLIFAGTIPFAHYVEKLVAGEKSLSALLAEMASSSTPTGASPGTSMGETQVT